MFDLPSLPISHKENPMNHTQFTATDDARAEQERAEAQLEETQATLAALAENAASAYAVLAAIIRQQMPETAMQYSRSTAAQMVDALVYEHGEDGLLEELGMLPPQL